MKYSRLKILVIPFLPLLPLVLLAVMWLRPEGGHDGSHIEGVVVDITPNLFEESLAQVEKAASAREFRDILEARRKEPLPVPYAIVTAKGDSVTKLAKTDSRGSFAFTGLPCGEYAVSAQIASGVSEDVQGRMASVKPIKIYLPRAGIEAAVSVPVRSDLVTLRGRVADVSGRPIRGARVRGEPHPVPESPEAMPPTRFAVSGIDGQYELRGFLPQALYAVAGYLSGGDPTEGGQSPFYVKVHAEADGYVEDKTNAAIVPLVTEDVLGPARRLLKVLSKWQTQSEVSSNFLEKTNTVLPSSLGNTITGIDIVLK